MPRVANKTNKVSKPTDSVENTSTKKINESEMAATIEMLMKKVEELTKLAQSNNNVQTTEIKTVAPVETQYIEYDEPNPNKQVRLVSLCYGELNLSTEPYGRGKLITFNKYGETKTILYSTLIDIVNNNREFAENGEFYILDKAAVYYLGLTDHYDGLMSKDIIDNIYTYSAPEITDLLKNTTENQRDTLVKNTLDKLFNGVDLDLNKCDIIGRCCGVDIMGKLKEMKETDKALKSK